MVALEAWTDIIDVTGLGPRMDPDWTFTDKKKHEHRCGKKRNYPTLQWIIDIPADDEYPEEGHYECRYCHETIEPGHLPAAVYREYIPGLRHYLIDGTEVSKRKFLYAIKKARQQQT